MRSCAPLPGRQPSIGQQPRRAGFGQRICDRAEARRSRSELAVETGLRVDLPPEIRHQLLRQATDTVRSRLLHARRLICSRKSETRLRPPRQAPIAKCPPFATSAPPSA